jgi:hypothetical protein
MPRPIIGVPKIHITSRDAKSTSSVRIGLREPQLGKRLREKRSLTYVETFSRIDVAGYQSNKDALDSLLRTISNEFPELSIDQLPLGIVSKCYLGPPFEVHICDFNGEIIEHFETHRPMAAPFERARCLALHPSYAFIEIFKDTLRAVFLDGAVSVITP